MLWVYLPDTAIDRPEQPTVVFAFPGATYTRAYYDLPVPGRRGYSMAEHLTAAGHIVVSCDHIGLGDSTPYEPFANLTEKIVVDADRAATANILAKLAEGSLVQELSPIVKPFVIGVGHSMGGILVTHQQVRYKSFDALVILGCSQLPRPETEYADLYAALTALPDPTMPPRQLFHGGYFTTSKFLVT